MLQKPLISITKVSTANPTPSITSTIRTAYLYGYLQRLSFLFYCRHGKIPIAVKIVRLQVWKARAGYIFYKFASIVPVEVLVFFLRVSRTAAVDAPSTLVRIFFLFFSNVVRVFVIESGTSLHGVCNHFFY